jgi:hypothetical protein
MPRPKNGYTNAAGQPIPGTHDPIKRYMNQTALKIWAYKQGQQGLPLWERAAIDVGATVHGMAELDLKGRPDREIEAYAHECLTVPDQLRKAFASFEAFRRWREQCHVRAIAQEVTLVSEMHQYGGTPDTIALIDGGLGLIDFKTSAKPYPDHLVALAAHGRLWEENHPNQPLSSYHLLCLPKDGSAFRHHAYADLSQQWELFQLWLAAYRLEKGCTIASAKKAAAKPAPAATVIPFPPAAAPKPQRARKPATEPAVATGPVAEAQTIVRQPAEQLWMAEIAPPPPVQLSMAELLRSYGHVKEAATC